MLVIFSNGQHLGSQPEANAIASFVTYKIQKKIKEIYIDLYKTMIEGKSTEGKE